MSEHIEPVFMVAIQNKFIGYNKVIKKIDKKIDHVLISSYDIDALFAGVARGTLFDDIILGFDDFTMNDSNG